MPPQDSPIGVFDSGIGGLTVLKAIRARCPRENLLYFGDTAHVPYGSKSREAVTRYSLEAVRFLSTNRVKAIVVACNTASALSLPAIREQAKVPVLGVIRPGADAAAAATRSGHIGIIGTEATIASGAYHRALNECRSGLRIRGKACPLFVPLVEEGWWRHGVAAAVAREYLADLKASGIDTLILGCTHYPLLKQVIQTVMGPGIRLIDSAEQTALKTAELLADMKIARRAGPGRSRLVVSDDPKRFASLARRLISGRLGRIEVHRFE